MGDGCPKDTAPGPARVRECLRHYARVRASGRVRAYGRIHERVRGRAHTQALRTPDAPPQTRKNRPKVYSPIAHLSHIYLSSISVVIVTIRWVGLAELYLKLCFKVGFGRADWRLPEVPSARTGAWPVAKLRRLGGAHQSTSRKGKYPRRRETSRPPPSRRRGPHLRRRGVPAQVLADKCAGWRAGPGVMRRTICALGLGGHDLPIERKRAPRCAGHGPLSSAITSS